MHAELLAIYMHAYAVLYAYCNVTVHARARACTACKTYYSTARMFHARVIPLHAGMFHVRFYSVFALDVYA